MWLYIEIAQQKEGFLARKSPTVGLNTYLGEFTEKVKGGAHTIILGWMCLHLLSFSDSILLCYVTNEKDAAVNSLMAHPDCQWMIFREHRQFWE